MQIMSTSACLETRSGAKVGNTPPNMFGTLSSRVARIRVRALLKVVSVHDTAIKSGLKS